MIALLLLVGAVTFFYVYNKWCHGFWNRNKVPGPEPSLLVGNVGPTLIFTKHMGLMIEEWYNKFNNVPYIGYYKLLKPAIVARDAELVKNVMIKDFSSFQENDHKLSKRSDPLLGQNPFFLDGDEWQAERKLITPSLSPAKIKSSYPTMQGTCDKLIKYLRTLSAKKDVELGDLSILFTIENVVKCGYSLDANCFQQNERSIFLKARDALFKNTSFGLLKFFLLPVLPQWLIEYLAIPIINEESAAFFRKVVADNKKSRKPGQPMNDIFETLLKMQDPNDTNDEGLTGRSVTLYFEGSETSSIALSFILYELANNPDVQDRLYAEISETLQKSDGELTFEAFQEMKYLENVFLEALRLHSPVLYMAKTCTRNYTLPSIGNNAPITIPPGTAVMIPVQALHSDPEHFPEPDKFLPERFDDLEVRNSPVYLPFGSGPRVCIGMRFASVQVRLALFHIVKNFRLSVSPNHKPIVVSPLGFMLVPIDGLLVNFEQRERD